LQKLLILFLSQWITIGIAYRGAHPN